MQMLEAVAAMFVLTPLYLVRRRLRQGRPLPRY